MKPTKEGFFWFMTEFGEGFSPTETVIDGSGVMWFFDLRGISRLVEKTDHSQWRGECLMLEEIDSLRKIAAASNHYWNNTERRIKDMSEFIEATTNALEDPF